MIKSILKRIWVQRRGNTWMFSELLIVFVLLWYATDFLFVYAKSAFEPKGYNTEHVYHIAISANPNLIPKTSNEDSLNTLWVKPYNELIRRIKSYPGVEAVCYYFGTESYSEGTMFQCYVSKDTAHVVQANIFYVSPDYYNVFKIDMVKGRFTNWNMNEQPQPAVLTTDFADSLFRGKSEIGNSFSDYYEPDKHYKVVGIAQKSKQDEYNRYDKFIYVPIEEYMIHANIPSTAVRVRAEADHHFAETFMNKMRKRLQVGPYYLFNIESYDESKQIYDASKGTSNYIKSGSALILFFIINIFLGVMGTFWFRTQSRSSEIGLRMALGSSKRELRRLTISEGIILLNLAAIPAIIICINIGHADFTFNKLMDFTVLRFFICTLITYVLMIVMVVLGVWYPSKVASNILPVDALRNE
jgi:putative ABC transport system permease protein